ncbi:tubulin glycylase 3A-like isoform X3 [Maniola jurtina]|uniref:tubulin glycylase 3A-like isoform X3 n=1 Tax=Maniola jurtina TaxID=191418 RepID=UPI001E689CED|nr:tubulin glycylase 3A-like isoform X3 [Maniola jurtina]
MPNKKRKLLKRKKNKKFVKSGVKRIFSPFHKLNYSARQASNNTKMTHESIHFSGGLSSKEKSYVISSCQKKSNRYVDLKILASKAIRDNKIFTIYGSCSAVRKALSERGWVEKLPANRMNLSKIRTGTFSSKTKIQSELERLLLSNLVEKHNPNFVWRTRDERRDTAIDMKKDCNVIINKLETDATWTSKQGLCSSIKRNYWFHIEDEAEVNSPRSYNTSDNGDIEGFVKDYKITACTSLLKWILSMVANDRPIFVPSGNITMNVMVFAVNRCKEYLLRKQNKDIDQPIQSISNRQWDSFLKKYYCIIAKDDVFEPDKANKLPVYLSFSKFLLKEIHKYRPQLSCEGCHNIWIIKPGCCSRGRGIRMASKLGVIINLLNKANTKYVIQKYIEEPLLIHETKFDIRQYYLVTSTYPLIIWMYKDCYLKFSSQKYNLKDYHESIHLTNNAVQRKYRNCSGRHADLPNNNMWDLDEYKSYLNKIGQDDVWDTIIYPGMKKSIVSIMLSCQDSLSVSKNRFELYGCDFILDKDYKPWLIEINSCPDLNHTTHVTAKICPAVVSDLIKVVIDYSKNPKASTGRFERIYRQPVTLQRYTNAVELSLRGHSLPMEYFYKGKIEVLETYEDPKIGKQSDIKKVLNLLKQAYNTETIMKQPDEDFHFPDNKEKDTGTHKTVSEYEMGVAANVINGQLDELMDRIVSKDNFSTENGVKLDLRSCPSSQNSLNPIQNVRSFTDLKTLLKKSANQPTTLDDVIKTFSFSKLDDGPYGKGSITACRAIEEIIHKHSNAANIKNKAHTSQKQDELQHFTQDVFNATAKVVSFINAKEKEYRS